MGSPLSPIMANLYMEMFEKKALDSYHLKSCKWKRFIDDIDVKQKHRKYELNKFFEHLNRISDDIKHTMELHNKTTLPSLNFFS